MDPWNMEICVSVASLGSFVRQPGILRYKMMLICYIENVYDICLAGFKCKVRQASLGLVYAISTFKMPSVFLALNYLRL